MGEAVRGKWVEKGEVSGYPGLAQSPPAPHVSLKKHSSGGDTPHLSDLCLLYSLMKVMTNAAALPSLPKFSDDVNSHK
ncbi:hypothetical protein Pcinc_037135 [Petrolisthes cinctipes]|uniref:Uncharacterized protein n=1 Tax=Petrolisthes cinctipes TaxID=88211 RepID=A0AAE1EL98_PETCI|nr:hypothetical protein Pcinc_037135 [Petrolisthes cinctipes]